MGWEAGLLPVTPHACMAHATCLGVPAHHKPNISVAGMVSQDHVSRCVLRAMQGEGGPSSDQGTSTTGGADRASHAGEQGGSVLLPRCAAGSADRIAVARQEARLKTSIQLHHHPPCPLADQAARVPPNVGAASRPSERSTEEPESGAGASGPSTGGAGAPESDAEGLGADEVMEQRVDHPEVGGIAS